MNVQIVLLSLNARVVSAQTSLCAAVEVLLAVAWATEHFVLIDAVAEAIAEEQQQHLDLALVGVAWAATVVKHLVGVVTLKSHMS